MLLFFPKANQWVTGNKGLSGKNSTAKLYPHEILGQVRDRLHNSSQFIIFVVLFFPGDPKQGIYSYPELVWPYMPHDLWCAPTLWHHANACIVD